MGDEILMKQAIELWPVIRAERGDYLSGPVSTMQIYLRLGYKVALQLVADLEQAGLLSAEDETGGRWLKNIPST